MVATPGVANSSRGGLAPAAAYLSFVSTVDSAFSVFAASPHDSHEAIKSSPASVGTMNSVEPEPPIAPEWASTWMVRSPHRAQISTYACRWSSSYLSRPSRLTSKEYESFMVNWRTRNRPLLGRGPSRNLVWI